MAEQAKQTVREFEVIGNTGSEALGPRMKVVDTAFCLSKLNHRLYRQGRQYTVKVDAHESSFFGTETIGVWALMPTWYLRSAWRMAKKAYDDAMADELAVLNPENVARWRDFRIGSGIETGTGTGVDMLDAGGALPFQYQITENGIAPLAVDFSVGEYNLSYAHNLDTGVNMKWWLSGGTSAFFGIFEEYAKSRNESASPETVIAEMPYEALKSEGEPDDYQEVQANGNEPPYNALTFPNSVWVKVGELSKDSPQRTSTGYFTAPLGMIALVADEYNGPAIAGSRNVSVEVKEGAYLGVHAPSM